MARHDGAIRKADRGDADGLFRMACHLATSAVPERSAFDTTLEVILTDPRQLLLVAGAGDNQLVGYLHGLAHPAFHANGNTAWVEELWIDEDHRHQGLARALMGRMETWALTNAAASYAAAATRRASPFYQAIGYAESATYLKKSLRETTSPTQQGTQGHQPLKTRTSPPD